MSVFPGFGLSLPYPGLRPFQIEEAVIFFGRDAQINQLLEKLGNSRFVAVIGPSGCGKSSLIRAGVLPALETGFLASAGVDWRIAEMRPGDRPYERLAEALLESSALTLAEGEEPAIIKARLQATLRRSPKGLVEALREGEFPEETSLLLLVDQFEEIFRFRSKGGINEADAFVALLLETVAQQEFPVYVLITMRTDFLGNCALFRGLPEAINAGQFLTPRLTLDELKEAIVNPAEVYDGEVEPRLLTQLLNDMGPDPDQLPLMQHVLMRMWTQDDKSESSDTTLTLSAYENAGTMQNALSQHAQEAYEELDSTQQYIARVLFCCLSERSAGLQDTRRPVRLQEVADVTGVTSNEVLTVVEVFRQTNRSFITPPPEIPLTPDMMLDISHESLLRQWTDLSKWIEEEADAAATYRRLEEAAYAYEGGRRDSFLDSTELSIATRWRDNAIPKPSAAWAKRYSRSGEDKPELAAEDFELAMTFLEKSEVYRIEESHRQEAARDEEIRRQEQERVEELRRQEKERAQKRWYKILGAICALLVCVAAFAWYQRDAAMKAEKSAQEDRKAALTEKKHAQIQRLLTLSPESEKNALMAIEAYHQVVKHRDVWPHEFPKADMALRRALATPYFSHTFPEYQNRSWAVAAVKPTKDHYWLAAGGEDGTLRVWDLSERPIGNPIKKVIDKRGIPAVAFDRTGKWLATTDDEYLQLWEVDQLSSNDDKSKKVPVGKRLHTVAFSPNGKWLATAGNNKEVKLWEVDKFPYEGLNLKGGHKGNIFAIAFDSRNEKLVSASHDAVKLWDIQSPNKEPLSIENSGKVSAIAFYPLEKDGASLLVMGTEDGDVNLWDINTSLSESKEVDKHKSAVKAVTFSPEGGWLATGGKDHIVKVWNLDINRSIADQLTGDKARPMFELNKRMGVIQALDFVDEEFLITGSDEGVMAWELRETELFVKKNHKKQVRTVAFNHDTDNPILASGGLDRSVHLYWLSKDDSHRKLQVANQDRQGESLAEVEAVAFSPTQMPVRMAIGTGDGIVWVAKPETDTDKQIWRVEKKYTSDSEKPGKVMSVGFSPQGQLLAAGWRSGVVKVWDLEAHNEYRFPKPSDEEASGVPALVFSPDGQTLAIGNQRGVVWLWKWNKKEEAPVVLGGDCKQNEAGDNTCHDKGVWSLTFNQAGDLLASASFDTTIRLWKWKEHKNAPHKVLEKHHIGWVTSLAFHPEKPDLLASGGHDGTVRLWTLRDLDNEDGIYRHPVVLRGHKGPVRSVAFSPDGKKLVSGSDDRSVRVWEVETETLAELVCQRMWRNLNPEEKEELNWEGMENEAERCKL